MQVKTFVEELKAADISTLIGVPDSTLKPFCDYLQTNEGAQVFKHYVPVNEGAAVGMAIGSYLATQKAACVYMQNSGIGNMVNPVTSLANEKVYGIPILFLIGFRGEPGKKDEPQHRFMGEITESMLEVLDIPHAVIGADTTKQDLTEILTSARQTFEENRQFAVVIKKDFFDGETFLHDTDNGNTLIREDAIKEIITSINEEDIVVSTTGKISREVYEQSDAIKGNHRQDFLTVGGMGHASMIALSLAMEKPDKRVYCLDGDGAVLMHMGALAFIANRTPKNLVHICLNNDAHESVGGMPTGCVGTHYAEIAKACGYEQCYTVTDSRELSEVLETVSQNQKLTFIEVKVAVGSRADLGRPKESAKENKQNFMAYHNTDA